MAKVASNFRQSDVERAIKAAQARGLPIARVEIDAKTNRIAVIMHGEDGEQLVVAKGPTDDNWNDPAALEKLLARKPRTKK